jgi:hypothetical protein
MTTPTLSQIADIEAKAAHHTLGGSSLVRVAPSFALSFKQDAPAREAFAKAVLDAVGYKFPVDPEREAFDAWMKEHESVDLTYFEAWKAGRAAVLAEQVDHEVVMPHFDSGKSQPETFEAHGLTWIKHALGDPMPCDGGAEVELVQRCGMRLQPRLAKDFVWGEAAYNMAGWRYANADAP